LPSLVRREADAMLVELELEHAELSVLLTNDAQIHALNLEHRKKDKPTDVLSFPLDEGGGADGFVSGTRVLGDVVISLDTAARQARGRKRDLLPEVRFLLAHGVLHLLGYDHGNPAEKRVMDAMTRRLVRAVEKNLPKSLKSPGQNRSSKTKRPSAVGPKRATRKPRPRARHAK
jgi:probable rRNA maturation factor